MMLGQMGTALMSSTLPNTINAEGAELQQASSLWLGMVFQASSSLFQLVDGFFMAELEM